MLTEVSLGNFKCFSRQELELRPLTVLIGPNGSGKSTVLQGLMLLRQSLGQSNPIFRRVSNQNPFLVDLVGFDECVYRRDSRKSIGIGFTASVDVTDNLLPIAGGADTLICEYEVEFAKRNGWATVIRNSGATHAGVWSFAGDWRYSQPTNDIDADFVENHVKIRTAAAVGRPFEQVTQWLSFAPNSTDVARQDIVTSVQSLLPVFSRVIDSWRFVPAIRGFPYSSHVLHKQKVDELRPAEGYDEMTADLASTLAYDEELEATVSRWIERVTDVPIEHGLDEGPGATVKAVSKSLGRNIPLILEGFGTNQLTFLMFQIAAAPRGGLVAIEEPETHLHPLAIAKLGDLFRDIVAQEAKQLLITTHSEHLLLSLLNNVAERRLSPDDLAIYYLSPGEGETIVRRVEVTSDGMVKGGLPGFFDAALEAQRRHLDALTQHS